MSEHLDGKGLIYEISKVENRVHMLERNYNYVTKFEKAWMKQLSELEDRIVMRVVETVHNIFELIKEDEEE